MNIIVTGAAKGIGKELVLQFSADKSNNIIAISRTVNQIKEFKSLKNVKPVRFDFINDNFEELINTCNVYFNKKIDILINNAGLLYNKSILEISEKEINNTFQVNLFAVIKLIKGLLPSFNANKNSHIVNISSMGGVQGSVKFNGLSIYSSSKGALITLTECLAEELKEINVSVNALALGAVQTEMLNQAFPDYIAPVSSKEMAEYIAEFALNGNKYFNGKVIPVSLSTP